MATARRLEGQVAIITGGASGFGKGIAKRFVLEGAQVLISDLDDAPGNAVAKELGCRFLKADVTKLEDWERLLKYVRDTYGSLTTVVNNAGTSYKNKVLISTE